MRQPLFSMSAPLRISKKLNRLPVNEVPTPSKLTVFMKQHMGGECQPVVKPRDKVKAGQTVGQAKDALAADVHSPAAGEVIEVTALSDPYGGFSAAVVGGLNGMIE